MVRLVCAVCLLQPAAGVAADGKEKLGADSWIARSNRYAETLGRAIARFEPESVAELGGVAGFDAKVCDLEPHFEERMQKALHQVQARLKSSLAKEQDPRVRADLEILVHVAQRRQVDSQWRARHELPYRDVAQVVFEGLNGLFAEGSGSSPTNAQLANASSRLKQYVGLTTGGRKSISQMAEERLRESLIDHELAAPLKAKVQRDIGNTPELIAGIEKLARDHKLKGCEEALAQLRVQLMQYSDFVRAEVLPRGGDDYRLPRERYVAALAENGVDIAPEELVDEAHSAFLRSRTELVQAAEQLVDARKLPTGTDWRELIGILQREGDLSAPAAALEHYQSRAREISGILEQNNIVGLPRDPLHIRLATAAENATVPAPFFRPSPLTLGTPASSAGEFVLVTGPPDGTGSRYTDFTYKAASFWVCCHEGRPGHELQFATMRTNGTSLARSVYAFNSVNVEGWAVYCEALMLPFMPKESQLVALQFRMARTAYAFLDAELQLGRISPEEAHKVLVEEVGISTAYADSLVRRFTFLAPGQATSYFFGFTRMQALRSDIEKALGSRFNLKDFHDAVLRQGLLPPAQLRKAVMSELVGS